MILLLVIILVLLWLLGFTIFHLGALIHLLLIIALVVFVLDLLTGSRPRL